LTDDRLGGDCNGGAVRLGGDPPSPWEEPYGFSRLVRVPAGELIVVGGTTSVDVDGVVVGDRPYEQTVEILRKIGHELRRVGASLADIVQTRAYVTDISRADEVGRAHGEAFGGVGPGPGGGGGPGAGGGPAMTMVEVSALIDPRMLVEIEALAAARA
jgi:enamine deaminase RidA (YjgF/YER057c/UK114 family)